MKGEGSWTGSGLSLSERETADMGGYCEGKNPEWTPEYLPSMENIPLNFSTQSEPKPFALETWPPWLGEVYYRICNSYPQHYPK